MKASAFFINSSGNIYLYSVSVEFIVQYNLHRINHTTFRWTENGIVEV